MADAPTTGTTAPAEGAGGLPQFDTAWWPGEMVWFVIIFAVVFALMAKVFVPRLGGTIAEREDRISNDIAQARKLKEQAEAQAAAVDAELTEARAAAQRMIAEAKARAEAEVADTLAAEEAAFAEGGEIKAGANPAAAELAARRRKAADAEASINVARDQALANVRAIAADTVQAIVGKLTGAPPTEAEVEQALAGRG